MDVITIRRLAKKVGEFGEAAEKVEKAFDKVAQKADEIAELVTRARGASESEVLRPKPDFPWSIARQKQKLCPS